MNVPVTVALLSLFGIACTQIEPTSSRRVRSGRKSLSFQVDPDDPNLWNAAGKAAEAWSYALGVPVTVAQDGEVPIFWVSAINDQEGCAAPADRPLGAYSGGCSPGAGTPDARILLNADAPEDAKQARLYSWLLHEMGHILGGRSGHLDDPGMPTPPGNAILRRYNTGAEVVMTLADVRYVCESGYLECPGPVGRLSAAG